LSRIFDRRPPDHEENAADHFSKKTVIGGVTAVIGKQPITKEPYLRK
jgi:hypothetical protein